MPAAWLSKLTLTPPSVVGRAPAGAEDPVSGPRALPTMISDSRGAIAPVRKLAALRTPSADVVGLVPDTVPVIVTENPRIQPMSLDPLFSVASLQVPNELWPLEL